MVNFSVPFNPPNLVLSPAPNPYTNSDAVPNPPPVIYQNPETFQIISPGRDRLYGVGGAYLANSTGDRVPIPDAAASWNSGGNLDPNIRQRERDNLSNFTTSRLD
jgi:hypothetical protein